MNESQNGKQKHWDKWGAIASIASALFALMALFPLVPKSWVSSEFLSKIWPYFAIAGSVTLSYRLTRWRLMYRLRQDGGIDLTKARKELEDKQRDLESCQNKIANLLSKPVPYYKRFELIPSIRYGHIEYPPLLYHTPQGEPLGIGITILNEIFKHNGGIEKHATRMSWEEIETLLYIKDQGNPEKYEIDIIATPIFETNDRSQKVGFTSPIFYSEIGLYYSKKNPRLMPLRQFMQSGMQLDAAITFIGGIKSDIKFHVIKGELSERMVTKYFSNRLIEETNYFVKDRDKVKVPELIGLIASGTCDIAFVETLQADLQIKSMGAVASAVANLLSPNELLYPVAYAL